MARPQKTRKQSEMLRVRVLPEIAKLIEDAAKHAARRQGTGTVSDWVRVALKKAAESELGIGSAISN